MPTYQITRNDLYLITFEAKDMNDALNKIQADDELLNNGSYAGSEFGEPEETEQ